jgi:hypothetical protein
MFLHSETLFLPRLDQSLHSGDAVMVFGLIKLWFCSYDKHFTVEDVYSIKSLLNAIILYNILLDNDDLLSQPVVCSEKGWNVCSFKLRLFFIAH